MSVDLNGLSRLLLCPMGEFTFKNYLSLLIQDTLYTLYEYDL